MATIDSIKFWSLAKWLQTILQYRNRSKWGHNGKFENYYRNYSRKQFLLYRPQRRWSLMTLKWVLWFVDIIPHKHKRMNPVASECVVVEWWVHLIMFSAIIIKQMASVFEDIALQSLLLILEFFQQNGISATRNLLQPLLLELKSRTSLRWRSCNSNCNANAWVFILWFDTINILEIGRIGRVSQYASHRSRDNL